MANITYIRIGDRVYGLHDENALTSNSNLDASKVVGTLPANTYVDTTYENKAAVEGGTDVSLVTTGDKYRWNNASGGGVSDVTVDGTSVVNAQGVAELDSNFKVFELYTEDAGVGTPSTYEEVRTAVDYYTANPTSTFIYIDSNFCTFVYDDGESTIEFNVGTTLDHNNNGSMFSVYCDYSDTSNFQLEYIMMDVQEKLSSGGNIKKINNNSILGSGNIAVQEVLQSGTNIKTINNQSILGSGNLNIDTGNTYTIHAKWNSEYEMYLIDQVASPAEDVYEALYDGKELILSVDNSQQHELLPNSLVTNCEAMVWEDGSGGPQIEFVFKSFVGDRSNLDYGFVQFSFEIDSSSTPKQYKNEGIINYSRTSLYLTYTSSGNNRAVQLDNYSKAFVNAQEPLVSGTNIKTINNTSLLGSGNIDISSEDNKFIVTLNETPYQLIKNAIDANKLIVITTSRGGYFAIPDVIVDNSAHTIDFVIADMGYNRWSVDSTNTWENIMSYSYQQQLTSGENIKTINNNSILGSGNLSINVPTNVSDLTNDSNFQNATQVEAAINTKISSVYKAKGSVAFANLPALVAANEGFVYNVTDDFITTSDFVEGAGAQYAAGTNVVIIDIGSGVYKYDVLASTVATPLGLVQKNESRYETTTSSEATIPIGISGFRSTDVLFVDINGLDLVQGTDYTISGTNIVLTTPITTIGTVVHFIAMRMAEVTTQDYAQLKGDPGTVQIVRW